jgi:aspartyl-tRNA(Asn)/glutamyl-tRNA(Gln) amidotransferase subunit A
LFSFSSIEQYHAQLDEGSISCVQAVQHYLHAIKNNQHLNAFLEIFEEDALKQAALLDALSPTEQKGMLHGVVIGIKDLICYKDHRVSASSKILEGFTSLFSATAVNKLLQEGAIIIGRQNCDEFGMGSTNENSAYGPVINSVDPAVVPGGSSGGSAVAVKAGLCMASLGTDTGGSVRLPADFCGTIGFKPSYGRVSRHGLIAYASSFDQIGVFANNVEDVALILEVIAGADNYDSTVSPKPVEPYKSVLGKEKKYRIAYFPEWVQHTSVDPEISENIDKLLGQLKEAGHKVEPVAFNLTDYIVPTYYILTTAEASSNLARFDGVRYGYQNKAEIGDLREFYKENRSAGFGKEVKRRIMLGTFVLSAGYYDAYFTKAQQVRRLLQTQTELIFRDFDIILAPNSPTPAYKTGEKIEDPLAMYMGDIFTVFVNLTGLPAISLPVFKHSSNLPFGIQAMANRFNDLSLLSFSHQLMQQ